MTGRTIFRAAWSLLGGHAVFLTPAAAQTEKHPETRRGDLVEKFHGIEVAAPYRWLEDLESAETKKWVAAQSAYARNWLGSLGIRARIVQRLTELWDYEKIGTPRRKAGKLFFTRQQSLQNQPVVFWKKEASDEEAKVLIDPNQLSKDGTTALSGWSVNESATLVAFGVSKGGSDWQEWRVREIETGKDLNDRIEWVKFSGASWSGDGKGFCYARYDAPAPGDELRSTNYHHKLFYHEVGDPQAKDTLLYERKDEKTWNFGGQFTEDGNYLVIDVFRGEYGKNALFYRDLKAEGAPVVELMNAFDAAYEYLGNDGPVFYLQTTRSAPRGRIVAVDLRKPEPENWRVIVPQSKHKLQTAHLVGDTFAVGYLVDARTRVSLFDLQGKTLRDVAFDGPVTARGFSGSRKDGATYYSINGFTRPSTVYHYDLASGRSTLYAQPKVAFDPDAFETGQVFYESKDGTRVPMFITHRRGLKRDGTHPTLLYGYGGFDISLTPRFSLSVIQWLEMGGIYAVPNLRGGGEYGEDWHLAGNLLDKQNVFDDFIAAAEWLIAKKYTSTSRLAISGRSNGGLLVGACMTQRPELFGAADAGVGVHDMLRFDKFTIGWAWKGEYGDPAEPRHFKNLLAYSPLHNLKKGTKYPPTLVSTADHDDRVFPAHSFKFGAALQWAQGGDAPILLRIDVDAGHGAGKPTSKIIEESADRWAFLAEVLEIRR